MTADGFRDYSGSCGESIKFSCEMQTDCGCVLDSHSNARVFCAIGVGVGNGKRE
jgi:hypothetical protein